jgi:transcriptional regulator with XRE-family HTH domain
VGRAGWQQNAEARERLRVVGQAIRHAREVRGVSQERLAFDAGLDRTFVSAVERGVRNPSLLSVFALATALDVDIRELFSVAPTNTDAAN